MNKGKSPEDFAQVMLERKKNPGLAAAPAPEDFSGRLLGGISLAAAGMMFWLYTYNVIMSANVHDSISYKSQFIFLQPFMLVFGLLHLSLGERTSKWIGPTTRLNKWGWLCVAICAGLGLVYLRMMNIYLHSHGYAV